jgi:hypothetical protein
MEQVMVGEEDTRGRRGLNRVLKEEVRFIIVGGKTHNSDETNCE